MHENLRKNVNENTPQFKNLGAGSSGEFVQSAKALVSLHICAMRRLTLAFITLLKSHVLPQIVICVLFM